MMKYAQGGLANVAQSLANKGRNGDTELVHMSPREVNGLQALARANGTSLTMNPNTGLPEAFRLEQLLPMAAGAALTIGSGGALSPLAASLLVGGGYGAATGSIEKGLMAGIGAYGGAGLATGLSAAGASAAAPEAVVSTAAPEIATQTGTQALGEAAATESFAGANQAANQAAQMNAATEAFAGSGSAANQALGANQAAQMTAANQPPTFTNMGRGIENIFTKEGATAAYKGMPTGTLPATASTLLMAGQQTPNVPGYQEDEYDRRLKGYRLSPNYQPYQAPTPNPYYRPTYAAEGGVMNSFDDSSGMDEPAGLAQGNLQKGLFGLGYADGGLSLGGYSDGGRMLKGPGDGMSDSIPGVIGGKQPARLADGEFVVPADVVSHLGNGSTDAGAKKLYKMMDKIRQARTGKKKQAPQVNVDKYLPMGKASGGMAGYAEGGIAGYAAGGVARYNEGGLAGKIQDAYNAGYSGSQIGAALISEGVTQAQAAAATGLSADVIAQVYAGGAAWNASGNPIGNPEGPARNTASTTTTAPVTPTPVTPAANTGIIGGSVGAASSVPNSVIKAAVTDMVNAGVSGAQIGRTLLNMGVSQAQAAAATNLSADIISQAYAGGATLPAGASAAGLPTRPALDASGNPIIPSFTNAQTAAFIRDNQLTTPAQRAAAFKMFNIQPDQQAAALALLASTNPADQASIKAATDAYMKSVQANPNAAIQNAYTSYNRAQDVGVTPIVPPIIPRPVVPGQPTTPDMPATFAGSTVYRPGFVPRTSGVTMSDAIKDPYSNAGLESLYSQMMGQYAKAPPSITDEQVRDVVRQYVGNGAEVGRQLINRGVPVNQTIAALKGYPQLTPDIINQAYLGGQALGTATPPPTLNTQYNYSDPATYYRPPAPDNLILTRPVVDAAFTPTPANTGFFTAPSGQIFANEAAYNAANASTAGDAGGAGGERAGGLLSIDRKKRAKYKK